LEPTLRKKKAKSISNQNTKPGKTTRQYNTRQRKHKTKTQDWKMVAEEEESQDSVVKVRKAADPTLTCTHLSLSLSLSLSFLSDSLCLIFVVGNCIVCGLGTHSEGRAKP